MRKPFSGDFRLSQGFGMNPDMYAKFGYKGHNGMDWATPTGTSILAPISGTVIEARDDTTGYGLYIKIENDKEGAVLGHNKSLSVKVGDSVTEGQQIAISDNTGNSTGPHTHFGYYTLPRDRSNGYGGFIDQSKLLEDDMYKGYSLNNKDSMKVAVDVLVQLQSGELVRKEDLANLSKKITDLEKSQKTLTERVVELEGSDSELSKQLSLSNQEVTLLKEENQKLTKDLDYYKPYKSRYEESLNKVPNSITGWQLIRLGVKKLTQKK